MVKVRFKYRDQYSRGQWSINESEYKSLKECKEWNGLGADPNCEYEILSVEEIKKETDKE